MVSADFVSSTSLSTSFATFPSSLPLETAFHEVDRAEHPRESEAELLQSFLVPSEGKPPEEEGRAYLVLQLEEVRRASLIKGVLEPLLEKEALAMDEALPGLSFETELRPSRIRGKEEGPGRGYFHEVEDPLVDHFAHRAEDREELLPEPVFVFHEENMGEFPSKSKKKEPGGP